MSTIDDILRQTTEVTADQCEDWRARVRDGDVDFARELEAAAYRSPDTINRHVFGHCRHDPERVGQSAISSRKRVSANECVGWRWKVEHTDTTLKTIAEEAGRSRSSVSAHVNGHCDH